MDISQKPRMPVGLKILVALQIIGGTGLLYIFASKMFWNELPAVERDSGFSGIILVVSISFLIFLDFSAAIGAILRKKWGWFFGAFYFAHSIMRYSNTILTATFIADELQATNDELLKVYFKYGGRIIVNSLVFLYFFKSNVLEYFDIISTKKARLILLVAGSAIFLYSFFSIIDILLPV